MQYFIDSPHRIKDPQLLPFSKEEYSMFKFGASDIGRKFSTQLFPLMESFLANPPCRWNRIIVYSSPFDFIPTATYTMALPFYQALEKSPLTQNTPVLWHKIRRTTTYTVDYGNLSAEERLHLIGNDTFVLDHRPAPDDLLVFMDDVKITGSHEHVVQRMLEKYGLCNTCCFYYFAILANEAIPPTFENQLNYAYVNTPERIIELLHRKDFVFNTRIVKYILASPESTCKQIVSKMCDSQRRDFIHLATGNRYSELAEYSRNFIYALSTLPTR